MIDRPVLAVEAAVGAGLVGEDCRRLGGVPLDEPAQGLAVGALTSRVSRSRIPATAVLPTAPRPARSFLFECLFFSSPPM